MKKSVFIFCTLLIALASCTSDAEKKAREAAEKAKKDSVERIAARQKYYDAAIAARKTLDSDKAYNAQHAADALRAYNDFFTKYPEDSLSAEFLFLSANLAKNFGNYQQAAVYYETIIDKHKNYNHYAETVFMAANLYDERLEKVNHGDERARQLYQFVIDNYPGTLMAEESKTFIQYIGKTDAEVIDLIIKQAEQDAKNQKK